jgi:anaerobic magnesium-protoporphyrin IX monomethyl ester cyclase
LDLILGLVWRGEFWNPTDNPIVSRDSSVGVFRNTSAPLIDMKHLHGNVWDLLPMDKYRAHNWQVLDGSPRQPYASIMTSLNCPYACSFCCIAAPFGNNVYRMRAPFEVVEEIFTLFTRYGVKTFKIVDEMFVLNEKHYTEICKLLIERNIGHKINIWAYARVDTVKPHTLDLLRRAGFRWLALGIESGSKHVRDGAQKALKTDDIREVVGKIQQAGINVIGNYIFGLPDDNYNSMHETLTLALELNTEFANFYSCQAYPGSKLYTEAVEKGWTLPETWAGYSQHNSAARPLDTNHVKAKEVLSFRDQAFQMYFTSPVYLQSVSHKFGPQAVEEIKKMTSYKLKRKLLEAA